MLTIGSIYGHGFDSTEFARLQKLGFNLRPEIASYAGSQSLRFIDFTEGPSLELIEVEDTDEYLAFIPAGMEPYCPGISLLLPPKEAPFIGGYERRFASLDPYRLHVNYDGSTDYGRPGWTYLNFAKPVVAGTFIWLTAFDEPRPASKRKTAHPNGATHILGLAFELDVEALDELAELTGAGAIDGGLQIGEIAVWSRQAPAGLPSGSEKDFPLKSIVIETECLDFFPSLSEQVEETVFLSRKAVVIETNPFSWDLVLVASA
ncbi:MAG: hypothetical protein ABSC51_03115 [Gaiellaceae bacterium]|jgi:hypothetical protein